MNVWKSLETEKLLTPLGSLQFFENHQKFLTTKISLEDMRPTPNFLLNILQTLVTRLTQVTHNDVTQKVRQGMTDFDARNNTQFFAARDLALAFIQTTALDRFIRHVNSQDRLYEENETAILNDLAYLYGLVCIQNHLPNLVKLGIFSSGDSIAWVQNQMILTCDRLTPNAVALADVLAPTDFVLNSVLGHSSGDIYKQLQKSYYAVPNGFERAKYWPEVTENYRKSLSKL